ncbi:RHS repeat-associated core domain-containing protein [Actinokineospora guangxiensis]|uniref:alpha-amylase n=1 Tax=Actinokineospora guangxiensis TaxID=1490288 RepID=A0ABW0EM21_9PSEU
MRSRQRLSAISAAVAVLASVLAGVPAAAAPPAPVDGVRAAAPVGPPAVRPSGDPPAVTATPGPARYAYDASGRLVAVTAADGAIARYAYDPAGNITGVEHLGSPAVAVLSAVPARVRPGDRLTLSGKGFAATPAGNAVTINGTAAAVASATAEQLTVTVGAASTSGPVVVTTAAGTASLAGLTVIRGDQPVITGFTPAVAAPGSPLTLTVGNTDPEPANNLVRVNGLLAGVTDRTATTLTVTVPPMASTGPVTLSTPAGTATSATPVAVPPAGVNPSDVDSVGAIPVGTATSVPVAAGKYAIRHFPAADNERFAASLTGGTFGSCGLAARMYDERNRQSGANTCAGGSAWVETGPVSGPGTRTIVLRNTTASAGSTSVTVHRVPADLNAGAIALDGTAKPVTIAAPGQNAFLTFTGTAGQRVIIKTSGASSSFGCCALSWWLAAPDGTRVGSAQNPNGTLDTIALPQDGTYRVWMNPDGGGVGSMTFAAWDVPSDVNAGTQALDGTPLVVTVASPGSNAFTTFEGAAGQRVIVQSSAASSSFGCCALSWWLAAPDGTRVGSAQNPNATLDTIALPQSGTYRLIVNPDGVLVGSMTFQAWTVPAELDAGAQALDGTAKVVTIDNPGRGAFTSFEGTTGQRVIVQSSAASSSFGCCYLSWWLAAPDGTRVGSAQNPNATLDTIALPQDGTYRIWMNPDAVRTGSMTFQAWTVPADLDAGAQALDGTPTVVTIDNPGRSAYTTFEGVQDQRVIIQTSAASSSFGCCYLSWWLAAPNGTRVGSAQNPNATLDTITLPQTGTYRIWMNPDAVRTGGMTFQAWAVPADLDAGAQALDGTPTVVTIDNPGRSAYTTFEGTTGQRVIVQTSAASSSFGCCYLSWWLAAPNGTRVGSAQNPNATLDTITLPQDGTYRLIMNPDAIRTGAMTFRAWTVPADLDAGAQALDGTPTVVAIDNPGRSAHTTFEGTTGQRVIVQSSAASSSFGCCALSWWLAAPNGTRVGSAQNPNGTLDTIALPQTGTYRIIVNPDHILTGAITLRAWDVPADLDAGTLPLTATPKVITVEHPGQSATAGFSGTSGQRVRIQSSASSSVFGCCALSWQVNGPTGTRVGSVGRANSTVEVTLPTTGAYRLLFNPDLALVGSSTYTATIVGTAAVTSAPAKAAPQPTPQTTPRPTPSLLDEAQVLRSHLPARVTAPPQRDEHVTADLDAPDAATPVAGPAPGHRADWTPDAGNLAGRDWLTRRAAPKRTTDLTAPAGTTAVSGHVRDLNGRPLAGIPVRMDAVRATTDRQGRFLLRNVRANATTVIVDGYAAKGRYGTFRIHAKVAAGKTTPLEATVWLPRLDRSSMRPIAAPTTEEVVLTTPAVPGLEVRLPAGTVVRDLDGNVVRELGITAIPLDRAPYPLPRNGIVPVYFTVQPGGAVVFPEGASVVYPNYTDLPAGSEVEFWNYDPAKGWHVYGTGRVDEGGTRVVPDAATRLWALDGSMFNTPGNPKPDKPWWEDLADKLSGDPVDLSTGLLTDTRTDLGLADVMPIALNRQYWQGDGNEREFGLNSGADFNMFLASENQYQEVDVYTPGGGRANFVRTSPGTGYSDAVFAAVGSPGRFTGSTIAQKDGDWVLTMRDGTKYFFPWYARVRAMEDRNGNRVTFQRTGGDNGEVSQITSPNGRWIAFDHDGSARVTRAYDNIGREVRYTYDAGGRLATVTDVAGGVTTYTYDAQDRITRITDARGVAYLDVAYDANGRVARQDLADGGSYHFAYTLDEAGRITETRVTQPNGAVRRVVFDANGMVAGDTQAHGTALARTTTYERGPDNRIDAVVDPHGRRFEHTYDAQGRPLTTTSLAGTPDAAEASVTYGPLNQPASTTDEAGRTTTYTYDAKGNPLTITAPDNRSTTLTWTSSGQVSTVTDSAGARTTYRYEAGLPVSVEDPLGRTTTMFVDAAGRPVQQTDPAGAATLTAYDVMDNPVRVTDPLGGVNTLGYDPNGNLTSFTDARGKRTTWTYDDQDRPTSRTDPLGRTSTTTYDPAGRPTAAVSRAAVRTETGYDLLDRPTISRFGVTGPTSQQSTVTYGYGDADLLTALTDTAGGSTTFTYDSRDRVTGVTGPNGPVSYGYDAAGRQSSTGIPGLPDTLFTYDAGDQLTGVTRGAQSAGITRDAAARPSVVTLPGGWTQTYTRDAAGQVTAIAYAHNGVPKGDLAYTYDAAGRRLSQTGSLAGVTLPQARSGLGYDDANRLVTADGTALAYDHDGNLLDDGATDYSWDARGQLTATSGAGTSASYTYAATGERTGRTAGGTTTRFLNDGMNPAAELDGAGAVTAGLLSGGVDQWFARTAGGVADSVLTDALGSPVALGRADGSTAATLAYDPFGAPTATGDRRGADLSFTGRQDDGTGLLHLRDRYYSPAQQRFVSEDPIGLAGGVNLYAYVENSPTNLVDPTGHHPMVVGCLVGGALGGALDYAGQRLSGRKVDWGWGGVGGAAAAGCAGGALGGAFGGAGKAWPKIKPGSANGPTAGKPFPPSVRDAALKENPNTCVYCRMHTNKPQVDHSIARKNGGNATLDNAQTTCPHCNASKGARSHPVNPPPGYRGKWPPSWW